MDLSDLSDGNEKSSSRKKKPVVKKWLRERDMLIRVSTTMGMANSPVTEEISNRSNYLMKCYVDKNKWLICFHSSSDI